MRPWLSKISFLVKIMFLSVCFCALYINRTFMNFICRRLGIETIKVSCAPKVKTKKTSTSKKTSLTQADKGIQSLAAKKSSEMIEHLKQRHLMKEMLASKPPNILAYVGKKDSARKFTSFKDSIQKCINSDKYTVYHLKHDDVLSSPWCSNCQILVVACERLYKEVEDCFAEFLNNNGFILSFSSSLENRFIYRTQHEVSLKVKKVKWQRMKPASLYIGTYSYDEMIDDDWDMSVIYDDKSCRNLVVRITSKSDGKGQAIFSQLYLYKEPEEDANKPHLYERLVKSDESRLEIFRSVLSSIGIDCSVTISTQLTPAHLLCKNEVAQTAFLNLLDKKLKNNCLKRAKMTLQFVDNLHECSHDDGGSAEVLSVVRNTVDQCFKYFDSACYWQFLRTNVLGNTVIYSDVVTTTMNTLEGLMYMAPPAVGLIAVAGRQTVGQGRGGNDWLSPEGCAMFTIHVKLDLNSNLGSRSSYLQHIASLSVVNAVCSIPGYEGINLRLKWPNDMYHGDTMKIGGVICHSAVLSNTVHCLVGCGFNVENHEPTTCINEIIKAYNKEKGTDLREFTTSELIARTVTQMEALIGQFQKEGRQKFCDMYYKYWLHSGKMVRVASHDNQTAEIIGLDDYGYLLVKFADGTETSLQPDGNTFDMMKNLISLKP